MKKKKLKVLGFVLLLLLFVSTTVFATNNLPTNTGDQNVVSGNDLEDEEELDDSSWVKSDLFLFKNNILVNSVVDGNAFIVGSTVEISGEIGGDLFVMADKVVIKESAVIYSSIFVCANEIEINGACYDLYASCGTCTIGENGFINRDAKIMADTVKLNGAIRRNAMISANTIEMAENKNLIYGDLEYVSEHEMTFPENAIEGKVSYRESVGSNVSEGNVVLTYLSSVATTVIFTFVLVMLVIWLAPKFKEKVTKITLTRSLLALGVAILSTLGVAALFILLVCTFIGASVGIVLLLLFLLICMISTSIACISVAGLITDKLKWEGKMKFVLVTLGLAIIAWAIGYIPVVGGILKMMIGAFGLGMLILNILPSKKEVKE